LPAYLVDYSSVSWRQHLAAAVMQPNPFWHRTLLACALALVATAHGLGDEPPIAAGGVTGLTLKTQLEKGLRVRRPVEFAYIDQINTLVEKGQLPRTLVASTFIWARQKPSQQLQYFQFALQARAKGLPVKLPDLRNQAVGISGNGGLHGFGNFGNDPDGP
jgi:hypothetical protein